MLQKVCNKYNIEGTYAGYVQCTSGHINDTYCVKFAVGENKYRKYIFQKINHYVFKDPAGIMSNIRKITKHWRSAKIKPDCDIVTFLDSKDGDNFVVLDGEYWRVSPFIENSVSYETVENPELLRNAGYAFGQFQYMLSDFPVHMLNETIPDFHNTRKRLADFFSIAAIDPVGRVKEVEKEIKFIEKYQDVAVKLVDMQVRGELPLRVVHNDTKYNNILMDKFNNKPLCIIDLDTVMPGLSMYDFGDAIRFAANTAAEDETDPSKAGLSIENYEAFASGFISASKDFLTKIELDNMALGAVVITIEQASRFLADYINGDKYYRINRKSQNLDRARCQIKLAEGMIVKYDMMSNIINKLMARV